MMRFAYNIITYLLLPVYALYWIFRGLTTRTYWDRLAQRFGFGCPGHDDGCIWIHAVSVGEVQASAPLVRDLARRFPDRQLLVTTVTPTGAARAQKLFGDSVSHCYLPFETPMAVNNFFDATQPHIALIMETEIWPNLYYACGKRRIPLVLVSARISPKSVDGYRKLLPLFRETLSYGIVIAAQTEADADRFRSLGAAPERTTVTGNIKFDIELDPTLSDSGEALRQASFPNRPVWVAASTHDQEEEMLLAAHRVIRQSVPDALLILVPRHPERFLTVRSLLEKSQIPYVCRTDNLACDPGVEVLLGDTMGEVPLFYAASDVAFVGGTLVPIGGHNLLEPASLGKPIIVGTHLFSTQEIADMFIQVGAAILVADERELAQSVLDLFADQEGAKTIGAKGFALLRNNRGSLQKLLDLLEPTMAGVKTWPSSMP